jgi:hypothetical protein
MLWEPCDDFEGPWKLVKVSGYELGEKTQLYFWGHDGQGELDFGGMTGGLACKYGETLEGLPAVTFKWTGRAGEKALRGSGLGAIDADGKTLHGSLKIGRRASAFVAHRD